MSERTIETITNWNTNDNKNVNLLKSYFINETVWVQR